MPAAATAAAEAWQRSSSTCAGRRRPPSASCPSCSRSRPAGSSRQPTPRGRQRRCVSSATADAAASCFPPSMCRQMQHMPPPPDASAASPRLSVVLCFVGASCSSQARTQLETSLERSRNSVQTAEEHKELLAKVWPPSLPPCCLNVLSLESRERRALATPVHSRHAILRLPSLRVVAACPCPSAGGTHEPPQGEQRHAAKRM